MASALALLNNSKVDNEFCFKNASSNFRKNGIVIVEEKLGKGYKNDNLKMILYFDRNIARELVVQKNSLLRRECNGLVLRKSGEILFYPIPPIVNEKDINKIKKHIKTMFVNVVKIRNGTTIGLYYDEYCEKPSGNWRLCTFRAFDCTDLKPEGVSYTYGSMFFKLLEEFGIDISKLSRGVSYNFGFSCKEMHPLQENDLWLISAFQGNEQIDINDWNIAQKSTKMHISKIGSLIPDKAIENYILTGEVNYGYMITAGSDNNEETNFINDNAKEIYLIESDLMRELRDIAYDNKVVSRMRNVKVNRIDYLIRNAVFREKTDTIIKILPQWTQYADNVSLFLEELLNINRFLYDNFDLFKDQLSTIVVNEYFNKLNIRSKKGMNCKWYVVYNTFLLNKSNLPESDYKIGFDVIVNKFQEMEDSKDREHKTFLLLMLCDTLKSKLDIVNFIDFLKSANKFSLVNYLTYNPENDQIIHNFIDLYLK